MDARQVLPVVVVWLAAAGSSLGCGTRSAGPVAATRSAGSGGESVYRSTRYHFELRIASNWELVPPSALGVRDEIAGIEVVAARRRDTADPATLAYLVTDSMQVIPGQRVTSDSHDLDLLEDAATMWMEASDIAKLGASRVDMYGSRAARVDGRERGPARRPPWSRPTGRPSGAPYAAHNAPTSKAPPVSN